MLPEQWDSLTGEIYEAARDANLWPRILGRLCEMLGASHGDMWVRSPRTGEVRLSCCHGLPEEDRQEYVKRWMAQDPWLQRLHLAPGDLGYFWPLGAVISDGELEAKAAYQSYFRHRDLHYGAGAWIWRGADGESLVTVFRAKQAGPFGDHELALGTRLAGHVRRSAQLLEDRHSLAMRAAGMRICFEELPFAVAILSQEGSVVHSNGRFQRLTGKADGLSLRDGRIVTSNGLAVMPEKRSRSFPVRRRRGTPYWASIRPMPAESVHPFGWAIPVAIFEVRDPDRATGADSQKLEALYGLTQAEARFAALLASGLSVKQAAEEAGIAEQTGRTHLKRAMAKTGTRRQAELISRIIALD
ncbi:MAG: helix-turn-helix transcriptional regulator [Acidobacteria bacterium]|nr:helix-turn-helix transcriptional regulator [Acidobacteriota bacterium]